MRCLDQTCYAYLRTFLYGTIRAVLAKLSTRVASTGSKFFGRLGAAEVVRKVKKVPIGPKGFWWVGSTAGRC